MLAYKIVPEEKKKRSELFGASRPPSRPLFPSYVGKGQKKGNCRRLCAGYINDTGLDIIGSCTGIFHAKTKKIADEPTPAHTSHRRCI